MTIKEDIAQANRILDKLRTSDTMQKDTKEQLIKSVERYKENLIERNNNNGSQKERQGTGRTTKQA